jgi:SAM-dependent methyltransferase
MFRAVTHWVKSRRIPFVSGTDFNQLLHDLRGDLLREMPRPVETMVSAGCAGGWYFDWIEEKYGHVARHVGVEYYSPRPDKLPANVEWIANTCSDMSGVADASCDLVFSGQNIEHLWADEVAGFLTEAARITRPGGWVVIDSPNRLMTAPLYWSHPEHTIELTVSEIEELLVLAGFTVTKRAGMWLCRDPLTRAILPLVPTRRGRSVAARTEAAKNLPEDSFVWWVEARRDGTSPPDAAAIRARIDAIYAANWSERVQRMQPGPGLRGKKRSDGEWVPVRAGKTRVAMYGPYMPLRPGTYRAEFTLAPEPGDGEFARFDVVAGDGTQIFATGSAAGMERSAALTFTVEWLTFGFQFRCIATGARAFAVRRGIGLTAL